MIQSDDSTTAWREARRFKEGIEQKQQELSLAFELLVNCPTIAEDDIKLQKGGGSGWI